MKKITFLLVALFSFSTFSQTVWINEIDADQTGTDTEEFIEIATSTPNQSLNGYIVVLFNGSSDLSYNAFDLSGFTTDGDGFFILGSDAIPGAEISLGPNHGLQNGADAVVIYQDNVANFPNGTPATSTNLVDALVYGTSDPEDTDLLLALNQTVQYDENLNGNKDTESLQRISGTNTFCVTLPTLRAANNCPSCTLVISSITYSCDSETAGTDTVTASLEFVGGGNENYTVQITSGSGTLGGDDPTNQATGTITISQIDENTALTVQFTSANCNFSEMLTAPECVPPTSVGSIGALRQATEGMRYILSSEAILTFQQDFRNQKFIEDGTGAILIDDDNDIITTVYNIGDGITGIQGTLSSFNGQMQFVPELDPGAPSSTGNTITPQEVSITQLNANPEDYESEYVRILPEVNIVAPENTWDTGTVYELTNADGSFNFRTSFFDADYIGQDVPTVPVFVAGIITERNNGEYYITARSAQDIAESLGITDFQTSQLSVFPNPAKTQSVLHFNHSITGVATLFAIDGKVIGSYPINQAKLQLPVLPSGLYILQVVDNRAQAQIQLVIE